MTMTFNSSYSYTWTLEAFVNGASVATSTQTFANAISGYRTAIATGSSGTNACAATGTRNYWVSKNPLVGQYLTTGDVLYLDSSLSTPATFPVSTYIVQYGYGLPSYAISTGGVIGALETAC